MLYTLIYHHHRNVLKIWIQLYFWIRQNTPEEYLHSENPYTCMVDIDDLTRFVDYSSNTIIWLNVIEKKNYCCKV